MIEQVGWIPTRSGLLFAALHQAASSRGTAVVLVPPFGWEAMSSARSLRAWARDLAAAGYPTVRFHLPGSGDSAGSGAAQDLDSWSAGLADVLVHTRQATGCSRMAVVGLGLGGAVAARAIADGAEVEDLVLWSTPYKGRLLLRELRAFAAWTSEPGEPPAAGTVEIEQHGVLWVHGYPLGARAQQQLEALDLTDLALRGVERALVLGRGTLPPDPRLMAALTAGGAEVVGLPGPAYDQLTVEPRLSELPEQVVATLLSWLPDTAPALPAGSWPVRVEQERQVRRSPVSAVVHDVPGASLTAVFVGAGATPRAGPSRLWVEAARRWADVGIASVRVDLEGIGEADGADGWHGGPEALYVEAYRPQVRSVLDLAVEKGLPARFLLVGLCSGGLWAAQTALSDDRVHAVVVLNSYGLVWPPPLAPLSPRERLRHLTRLQTWTPLLHDPVLRQDTLGRIRRSVRLLADRVVGEPAVGSARAPATTAAVLRALEARGTQVTLGVSPGEPLLDDLAELPADAKTRVVRFVGPPGAHTLSPAVLRAQAEQLLDEAARAALLLPHASS